MPVVAGLEFDALTEEQVVTRIVTELEHGEGGRVVTPNVDICRQASRNPEAGELIRAASTVVADGMPLVWASRLQGDPLPERVTGASPIFSLSAAASPASAAASAYQPPVKA